VHADQGLLARGDQLSLVALHANTSIRHTVSVRPGFSTAPTASMWSLSFLVDSRSRPGQSGAPVLLYLRPGDPVIENDDVYEHGQFVHGLVGLSSGRIHDDSDLGMVWTAQAIREVLTQELESHG
jgi:hypothetical protein